MKEIIIGYFLSFFITVISGVIYTLLGFDDLKFFINNCLIYILLIYYLLTIRYHYQKNFIKEEKLKIGAYFPLIVLGISFATIYNMIVFKFNPPISSSPISLILLILSTGIIGPIFEEILFRYLYYNKLKKKYSIKLSILINSLIFAFVHMTPISMIYALLLGIILNVAYEKYKNIKAPIIIHIAGNIIVLFLKEYNLLVLILATINLFLSIIMFKQRK